jgi:CDP-glycerol glycerophosphotransferase (TagB/SpsB family)
MLIKGGEKSEKIMVTGAPRYDSLFRKIGNDKDFFRMRLHLKPKQKYVCLLTSFVPEWNTPEHRLNLLRAVFQSLEKTDFDLLIKLHPREDIKEIQNLIKAISADNRMNQRAKIIDFANVDLFDVILASDIVVSVRTSAVISALLAKKPLILIQYDSSLTEFFPDIEMSIFGVAKSNNDLLYLITKAITNSSLAEASTAKGLEYARRYVPYENATDRVVNCIMELLDKN